MKRFFQFSSFRISGFRASEGTRLSSGSAGGKQLIGALTILFSALSLSAAPAIELDDQSSLVPTAQAPGTSLPQLIQNGGNALNTGQEEFSPFISPDGRLLFFQSNRPGGYGGHDLWYSENKSYLAPEKTPQWTLPRNMDIPLNSVDFEGMPSILFAEDGRPLEIYFTALGGNRPGYGKTDLYVSRYVNDNWTPPENITIVNSPYHDRMPGISRDGTRLFFSSDRPGGQGKSDIYMASRGSLNSPWNQPVNIGPAINSPDNEFSPFIHQNTLTLYFSSDRAGGNGGTDIYFSNMSDANWSPAGNLGAPVNSAYDEDYPSVDGHGEWMFFSSDRPGGLGYFDIYRAKIPKKAQPPTFVRFEGLILDGDPTLDYERALNATVRILGGPQPIVAQAMTNNFIQPGSRNFSFRLAAGRDYKVKITHPNYQPVETTLFYSQVTKNGLVDHQRFVLEPVPLAANIASAAPLYSKIKVLGRLMDKETNQPLGGGYVSYSFSGMASMNLQVNQAGEFTFEIPANHFGKDLYIQSGAIGYQTRSDMIKGALITGPEQVIIIKLKKNPVPQVTPGNNQNPDNITNNTQTNPPDPTEPDKTGPPTEFSLHKTLLFARGAASLPLASQAALGELAQYLKDNPGQGFVIDGHTSKVGGQAYNQKLSWSRARYVYKSLISLGVSKDRLMFRYFGYSQPKFPNAANKFQRAQNRRVEVRLFTVGQTKLLPPPPMPQYKPVVKKTAPKKKKKYYPKKKYKYKKTNPSPNFLQKDQKDQASDIEVF